MGLLTNLKRFFGSDPDGRPHRDKIRAEAVSTATSTREEIARLKRQREIAVLEAQYTARVKGKQLPAHR